MASIPEGKSRGLGFVHCVQNTGSAFSIFFSSPCQPLLSLLGSSSCSAFSFLRCFCLIHCCVGFIQNQDDQDERSGAIDYSLSGPAPHLGPTSRARRRRTYQPHYTKSPFFSLLWGSLRLAPKIVLHPHISRTLTRTHTHECMYATYKSLETRLVRM